MEASIEALEEYLGDSDGPITADQLAEAELEIEYFDKYIATEFDNARKDLQATNYQLSRGRDEEAKRADRLYRRLRHAMVPFRRKEASPKKVAATPAATSSSSSTNTTARTFVVKDHISAVFKGEGEPSEILGGYRRWIGEWKDALVALNALPGISNSVRLIKLQQGLGGEALKLVSAIPAKTEDGYDRAMQRLHEKFHDPVAFATALLKAAETDKRPRAVEETFSHIRSLREAMREENVELEDFFALNPVLDRLSEKERTSWKRYVVSLRTRHDSEQARSQALLYSAPGSSSAPAAATDTKSDWKVGHAYNSRTFSNWREEYAAAETPAEEGGVHLAGAGFRGRPHAPSSSSSSSPGCAVHSWSAGHASEDCSALRRMDSATWAQKAWSSRACIHCARKLGLGHRCPTKGWGTCGERGHIAARCGHHRQDASEYRRVSTEDGPATRRRPADQDHSSGTKRHRAGSKPRKGRGRSPSGTRQPPHPAPGPLGRSKGRGKKSQQPDRQKNPP